MQVVNQKPEVNVSACYILFKEYSSCVSQFTNARSEIYSHRLVSITDRGMKVRDILNSSSEAATFLI